MEQEDMRTKGLAHGFATGPSQAEPEDVSALRASVPCADALVALMSAWGSQPASKFHKAYPFFEADRLRTIADYSLEGSTANLEATALLFAEYADGIHSRASIAKRDAEKMGVVLSDYHAGAA